MTMMAWAPSDWKKDESNYLFSGAILCSGSNVYIVENPDSILSEVSLTLSRNTVMVGGDKCKMMQTTYFQRHVMLQRKTIFDSLHFSRSVPLLR